MRKWIMQHQKGVILAGMLFLAYLGTEGMGHVLKSDSGSLALSNSVLSVFVFAGIFVLYGWTGKILKKRLVICAGILGFLFSAMLIIGTKMYLYDTGRWNSLFTYFEILELTPVIGAVLMNIFYYWNQWMERIRRSWLEKQCARFTKGDRKFFLVTWGGTFLCWVPGLLSAFPGIYAYDAIYQMHWFKMGTMNAHHPVAHTYFLAGCMTLGEKVFGSDEAGMLIYSLIQMAVMSGIFAYISKRTSEKLPHVVQVFFILMYALLPYNALFSFSATKDVLFAGLFALLVLKSYEIVQDEESFFGSIRKQIGYAALVFGMCAFRNNGIYAFACLAVVFLIVCRKYWKNVLLICLGFFLLWGVYTGPVYQLLDISEGSVAEALSVPVQQLARAMRDNADELSNEDKELIQEYLPTYDSYEPRISDQVKNNMNTAKFKENKMEFISLWVRVGLKCPITYLDAFASTNFGFWYPDMIYRDPGAWHPYIEYFNSEPETADIGNDPVSEYTFVERTSYLSLLSKVYDKFSYETVHQYFPVLSMLFSPGFAFWIVCIGITYCIYRKKYQMAVPLSLMTGLWITLILSPVVLLRYAYPLIVSIPVVFCMMQKEKTDLKSR